MNKFQITTPYDFDKKTRDAKRERTRKVQSTLRDWIVRGFKTAEDAERGLAAIIAETHIIAGELIVQEYTPLTELNTYFN